MGRSGKGQSMIVSEANSPPNELTSISAAKLHNSFALLGDRLIAELQADREKPQ